MNKDDQPEVAVTRRTTEGNQTASWRNIRPLLVEKGAPCSNACPACVPVPRYFNELADGNIREAGRIIVEFNPFPSVTGRLCPANCQTGCNRKQFDERVSIRDIERYVGDQYMEYKADDFCNENPTGHRTMVLGSGPASMTCAFYLALSGHMVEVNVPESEPGGILRYDVTEDRIPDEVLEKEIDVLVQMGVCFQTDTGLSGEVSLREKASSYDAVFAGITDQEDARESRDEVDFSRFGTGDLTQRNNNRTGQTEVDHIFVANEFFPTSTSVVEAIAKGRINARAIDRFLRGENDVDPNEPSRETTPISRINLDYFRRQSSIQGDGPSTESTSAESDEDALNLTREQVASEVLRCFSCGTCNSCGNCYVLCPDAAIRWENGGPKINLDFCKGCGICKSECPSGVIEPQPEEQ